MLKFIYIIIFMVYTAYPTSFIKFDPGNWVLKLKSNSITKVPSEFKDPYTLKVDVDTLYALKTPIKYILYLNDDINGAVYKLYYKNLAPIRNIKETYIYNKTLIYKRVDIIKYRLKRNLCAFDGYYKLSKLQYHKTLNSVHSNIRSYIIFNPPDSNSSPEDYDYVYILLKGIAKFSSRGYDSISVTIKEHNLKYFLDYCGGDYSEANMVHQLKTKVDSLNKSVIFKHGHDAYIKEVGRRDWRKKSDIYNGY